MKFVIKGDFGDLSQLVGIVSFATECRLVGYVPASTKWDDYNYPLTEERVVFFQRNS
jgi:hypothetical protein